MSHNKRQGHSRGNSIFQSFSSGTAKLQTYGKKRPSHTSVLAKNQLDQQLWNQAEEVNVADTSVDKAVIDSNTEPGLEYNNQGLNSSKSVIGLGLKLEPLELENKENDFVSWEQETTRILTSIKPQSLSVDAKSTANSNSNPNGGNNRSSSGSFKLSRVAKALSSLSNSSRSSKIADADSTSTNNRSDSLTTLHRLSIRSLSSIKSKRDSVLTEKGSTTGAKGQTTATTASASMDLSSIPVVTSHASYSDFDNSDLTIHTASSDSISSDAHLRRSQMSSNLSVFVQKDLDDQLCPTTALDSLESPSTVSFETMTSSSTPKMSDTSSMRAFKKDNAKPRKIDKCLISSPTVTNHGDHFVKQDPNLTTVPSISRKDVHIKHKRGHKHGGSILSSFSSHSSLFSLKSSKSKDVLANPNMNMPGATIPDAANSKTNKTSNIENNYNHKRSISLAHRPSFSDVKRSIMSLSPSTNSLFRSGAPSVGGMSPSPSVGSISTRRSLLSLNGGRGSPSASMKADSVGNGFDKSMISLPTPVDSSREKLRNKLKASNSLLSLTRTDTGSSSLTHGIPVQEYQDLMLKSLLGLCNSSTVVDFDHYMKEVISDQTELQKLAEASFSEVYIEKNKQQNTSRIYKVIPFGNEDMDQLPIQDIIQELRIARLLMSLDGYVDVIDAAVVKGTYSQHLVSLWDKYNEEKGSENLRPEFKNSQLYCILVMSNAGTDLEHFEIHNWQEAESIFWQTVHCLKEAEENFDFEHRDLHWGNIVISEQQHTINDNGYNGKEHCNEVQDDIERTTEKLDNLQLDDDVCQTYSDRKLRVTLIDYTLSRANGPNGSLYYTRLDHPDFFRGRGDYQFDIYRFMRATVIALQRSGHANPAMSPSSHHIGNLNSNFNGESQVNWSFFCPRTNVLWLHYLVDKLINDKDLEKVVQTRSGRLSMGGGSNSSLRTAYLEGEASTTYVDEEARAYRNLELIHRSLDPRKKRFGSRKGTAMTFQDFGGAKDILDWGANNGLVSTKLNLY